MSGTSQAGRSVPSARIMDKKKGAEIVGSALMRPGRPARPCRSRPQNPGCHIPRQRPKTSLRPSFSEKIPGQRALVPLPPGADAQEVHPTIADPDSDCRTEQQSCSPAWGAKWSRAWHHGRNPRDPAAPRASSKFSRHRGQATADQLRCSIVRGGRSTSLLFSRVPGEYPAWAAARSAYTRRARVTAIPSIPEGRGGDAAAHSSWRPKRESSGRPGSGSGALQNAPPRGRNRAGILAHRASSHGTHYSADAYGVLADAPEPNSATFAAATEAHPDNGTRTSVMGPRRLRPAPPTTVIRQVAWRDAVASWRPVPLGDSGRPGGHPAFPARYPSSVSSPGRAGTARRARNRVQPGGQAGEPCLSHPARRFHCIRVAAGTRTHREALARLRGTSTAGVYPSAGVTHGLRDAAPRRRPARPHADQGKKLCSRGRGGATAIRAKRRDR